MCWQCGMFCPVCLCFCYISANGSRNEKFDPVLEYVCFDERLVVIFYVWYFVLLCRTKSFVAKIVAE